MVYFHLLLSLATSTPVRLLEVGSRWQAAPNDFPRSFIVLLFLFKI